MDGLDIFQRLALALAIGLLIGIERQRDSGEESGKRIAGARTFAFAGLLGGIAAWLDPARGRRSLSVLRLLRRAGGGRATGSAGGMAAISG